jgi:hypothetical protein
VLITGEVDRVTGFEKGFPVHQAWRGQSWEPDPLILDDQALIAHVGPVRGAGHLSGSAALRSGYPGRRGEQNAEGGQVRQDLVLADISVLRPRGIGDGRAGVPVAAPVGGPAIGPCRFQPPAAPPARDKPGQQVPEHDAAGRGAGGAAVITSVQYQVQVWRLPFADALPGCMRDARPCTRSAGLFPPAYAIGAETADSGSSAVGADADAAPLSA